MNEWCLIVCYHIKRYSDWHPECVCLYVFRTTFGFHPKNTNKEQSKLKLIWFPVRLLSHLKKNEDRAHIKIFPLFANPSDTTHQMPSVKKISSLYLVQKCTHQCNYTHAAHHHTECVYGVEWGCQCVCMLCIEVNLCDGFWRVCVKVTRHWQFSSDIYFNKRIGTWDVEQETSYLYILFSETKMSALGGILGSSHTSREELRKTQLMLCCVELCHPNMGLLGHEWPHEWIDA